MENLLVIIGLMLSLIITTSIIIYQYLFSEFNKAKKEHKRFSRTVEIRRKKMEEDFIKLGESFQEMEKHAHDVSKSVKDLGKGLSELKGIDKCTWENKGEDNDKKRTNKTKD